MPLLRYEKGAFVPMPLHNERRNFDAFLCCPGPSLKKTHPASLRVPGARVVAVNTAYPYIRPDTWVGMDAPQCYDPLLWWEPFPKISGTVYINATCCDVPIRELNQVYFATGLHEPPWKMFDHLAEDSNFVWPDNGPNTFHLAIHLLAWMGVRNIYLVGCDFGGTSDYYDGRTLDTLCKNRNATLYRQIVNSLPILRIGAERVGMRLVSCTEGSPANQHLDYMTIQQAAKEAQKHVPPIIHTKVLDAGVANECQWTREKSQAQAGVVTGADSQMEWALPWWYENFKKHCGLPVVFADFGMSPKAKKWCADRGAVIDLTDGSGLAWFKKPRAILQSPFDTTVWIDIDCEVRGDILPIVEAAKTGVAVTEDLPTQFNSGLRKGNPYATGVVGASRGDGLITSWAQTIVLEQANFRGDQEAFNSYVGRVEKAGGKPGIVVMDPKYQWLRLQIAQDGHDNPDAVIVHWTGPAGKQHIMEQAVAITDGVLAAPPLSIISTVCGRLDLFKAHLDSLAADPMAKQCEYCVAIWGESKEHVAVLESHRDHFRGIKVAMLDHTDEVIWPLPVAYNDSLKMATSANALVVGSDVLIYKGLLAKAATPNPKTATIFGVMNTDGMAFVSPTRKVALPFCMAVATNELTGIGGWDCSYCGGYGYDDNDLAARLLISGVKFRWDFGRYCAHLAHERAGGDKRRERLETNKAIWQGKTAKATVAQLWPVIWDDEKTPSDVPADDGVERQEKLRMALLNVWPLGRAKA